MKVKMVKVSPVYLLCNILMCLPFTHFQVLEVNPGSFCAPIHINWVLSLGFRRSNSAARNVEEDPRNPCAISPLVT